MKTVNLTPILDHIYLVNKYCTCSESDILATSHKDKCGYKEWFDKWERERLNQRPWLLNSG